MNAGVPQKLPGTLLILMLVYGAASLLHFVHNAEFLADYPNMPGWLTRAQVYGVWLGVAVTGVVGYFLIRFGFELLGLMVIAVYAVLGFAGLDHYTLAPVSAHSAAMNATIWLEVAAAAVLLATTVKRAWSLR